MSTPAAASNARDVIELNLQFEDNEVLDVIAVHVLTEFNLTQELATDTDLTAYIALFEDPDKALATDLSLEATFEDDNSLIYFSQSSVGYDFGDNTSQTIWDSGRESYFVFPQPYTVARNLALISQMDGTEGDAAVITNRVTIWGRRRNASDVEFKNIIYRQRF